MNYKCDTDERVCFYEQEFYVLSNFSAFNLKWMATTFPTAEHAYQWEHYMEAGDYRTAHSIRTAPSAHEAFRIAQDNKHTILPERERKWQAMKVDVMLSILRAKVMQHPYVEKKLRETGTRELVEDSWRDDYWGWGPNRDGQNMLGKLWMQVRAEMGP